jgi:hypothetical protein
VLHEVTAGDDTPGNGHDRSGTTHGPAFRQAVWPVVLARKLSLCTPRVVDETSGVRPGVFECSSFAPEVMTLRLVLAWLMRHPRDDGISTLLGPRTWTTHLRAVIYDAIRSVWNWARITPRPRDVQLMYESFLVRAPGWAADDIGWPDARHAMRYFHRIAATCVTAAETYMAALALARADATATSVESSTRHAVAGDMRRVLGPVEIRRQGHRLEQAPLLVAFPVQAARPAGLVPSM